MLLSTPERRVYLALPEKALIPPVVYLYRIMVIDPSSPTFLLVHETLWDHTIEILDPALL
ncbi:MAG TPA: hypothetical protein VKR06_41220 [Ktedonosporobacter sp.]|nr:hypothetical protein [Ktedonosporobacter sp.]